MLPAGWTWASFSGDPVTDVTDISTAVLFTFSPVFFSAVLLQLGAANFSFGNGAEEDKESYILLRLKLGDVPFYRYPGVSLSGSILAIVFDYFYVGKIHLYRIKLL